MNERFDELLLVKLLVLSPSIRFFPPFLSFRRFGIERKGRNCRFESKNFFETTVMSTIGFDVCAIIN